MSLPVSPWCVEKHILRMAMRDRLPESVRTRSKTPLAGDPVLELLQHTDARWQDALDPAPLIEKYVDLGAVPSLAETQDADQVWSGMRPLCLNFWMRQQASRARVREPEEQHEVA